MKAKGGYIGKYIDLNLFEMKAEINDLPQESIDKFIGGRGFTSEIQYRELSPGIDPFSPENILVFASGPLTGTLAPSAGRTVIAGKSPLTGILGDSNMGGYFGYQLKSAGFDYIVVRGSAPYPVYLFIDNEEVRVEDARDLWGEGVIRTEDGLQKKHGENVSILSIGQAGENRVRHACVISDALKCAHAAGKTGMGAIMGSKKLKAIVVRGNRRIETAHLERMKQAMISVRAMCDQDPDIPVYSNFGTPILFEWCNGEIATKNWREGWFDRGDQISAHRLNEYRQSTEGCFGCHVRCHQIVQVKSGKYQGRPLKVEFVPLVSFGSNVSNDNLELVIKANELCNDYGMDASEGGAVIAFAMECYERGVISKKDADSIDLTWGNGDAILKLIEKTALREGFGDILAEGVKRASETIGQGSSEWAMQIKGHSLNMMDPRGMRIVGSRIRTSTRGADHLRGQGPKGRSLDALPLKDGISELIFNEHNCAVVDMMGVCKFLYGIFSKDREVMRLKMKEIANLYSAATGIETDVQFLLLAAERVINIERAFGCREGLRKKDDEMPRRFIEEEIPKGPMKGKRYDISNEFIEEYYKQRRWDEEGVPRHQKLEALDLNEICFDLKQNL